MSNLFPAGVSVITLVTVERKEGSPLKVVSKRSLSNSRMDLQSLPRKEGQPLFGPNSFREMTLKEIAKAFTDGSVKAAKAFKKAAYTACLVPLFASQVATAADKVA